MSFISDTEKSALKASYKTFFDTFKKSITIHKRGKVSTVDVNLTQLFGYNEPSSELNHTYALESQNFSVLIIYPNKNDRTSDLSVLESVRATINNNEIIIKTESDCKTYLNTGTIEKIDIEGKVYKLISQESQVNSIIDNYFLFRLEEVR
jgi:hypothetical protein